MSCTAAAGQQWAHRRVQAAAAGAGEEWGRAWAGGGPGAWQLQQQRVQGRVSSWCGICGMYSRAANSQCTAAAQAVPGQSCTDDPHKHSLRRAWMALLSSHNRME